MVKMKVLKLLNKITDEGYEAYIVGGFVRDTLMKKETFDVDITTNAYPEIICKIFNTKKNEYGCVSFEWEEYHVEVTTYRKEISYIGRRPNEYYFTDDILIDLQRRDFTVNAICMDYKGDIYDPFGGVNDLKEKRLKVIGKNSEKFTEDPLRILRAIRFSVTHNLKMSINDLNILKSHIGLITNLSYFRKKLEITKIIQSENIYIYQDKIKPLFNILEVSIPDNYKCSIHPLVCWAQLEFSANYPFTKKELEDIKKMRLIIKLGYIDKMIILEYGVDIVLQIASLLGYEDEKIRKMYNEMVIKNKGELKIDGNKIKEVINSKNYSQIEEIKKDLIINVLSGNLSNSEENLIEYIIEKWSD